VTRWTGPVALVLASSTGGIGQHVASLAAGLSAAGATVTVCGPAATEERFGFTGRGAAFVPVEIPPNPRPGDVGTIRTLRRALDDARVDLVHAHGLRAGFVAALASGRRPLVVTWHNSIIAGGLRGRAGRLVERIVARRADLTLGASADLVRRAAALGAKDARPGTVAAPALPAPARSRATVRAELGATGEGVPVILSVGRLHPQKGYPILIDAAARWRDLTPPPVVVIAGSGPSYLQLAARVSAVRAPVTLLGHRTDVADLLASADLAVVSSVWEARQLFAQEAMRAGVPLVATGVGGLPDLVGDAAVLVPPGDVDALDGAVRGLLADVGLRAEYARRAVLRAEQLPTEADTLDQVRAVYAELAPQPDTPAAPPSGTPTAPPSGTPTAPPSGTPAAPPSGAPSGQRAQAESTRGAREVGW
jgi:glycosyltransferase involved in cell wall biosynthesis